MQPLLEATAISKSFGGVRALKNVSFDLYSGEVHALVGENGAGKSTLIKTLTGAIHRDAGELRFNGQVIDKLDPQRARELGIAAIYQQPALFPGLSAAENIALAREINHAWSRVHWRERRDRAAGLLSRVGAAFSPDTPVSSLSMPEQQLLEIAKALDAEARVLIMDEPTASLGERDAENLFRIVGELRATGIGIIYISHRFEELFRLADRVTVLRDGNSIDTRPMRDASHGDLIRMMVGRDLEAVFPKRDVTVGNTLLEVRDLHCAGRGVNGVNLHVRQGEILGLAGLIGSGRTEFAETLFGLSRAGSGAVLIDGKAVSIRSPSEALAHGLAYVPEDRRRNGLVMDMPVSANTTLASLSTVSRSGLLRFGQERTIAQEWVDRLGTKTPSVNALARNLSGGNQQKVSLARWLMTNPRILILDEPTQGIDVGAKAEIYRLIGDLAARGLAILLISSELTEVLALSDRIAVMRAGRIAATLTRAEATPDAVMHLALGTETYREARN